jgi:ABC-type phosphate/phosphonate transport system substrate-binding protein
MASRPAARAPRSTSPGSIWAFLLLLASGGSAAAGGEVPEEPVRVTIGYSAQVFVDVDVEAWGVAKVWSDQIMKRTLGKGTIRNLIFRDAPSLEASLRRKDVDVVVMIADEYVELKGRVPMQPVFVPAHDGGVYQSVVLLVRRSAGIRNLGDLKGKKLSISIEQDKTIHLRWLEILLMREGVRGPGDFFSKVGKARGPSEAILSVFFGQSDACLTTMQAFRVASELNPQVENELTPLARSPEAAGAVIVFRPDFPESEKKDLAGVMASLHLDPEGRQLLRLFRMSRLVPFKEEYLATVEELRNEHDELERRLVRGRPK